MDKPIMPSAEDIFKPDFNPAITLKKSAKAAFFGMLVPAAVGLLAKKGVPPELGTPLVLGAAAAAHNGFKFYFGGKRK